MPLLWKLVSWCGDSLVSLWNSRVWQRGILFIQHGVFHPVRSFGHLFYLANPLVRQLQILFRTGTLFVTMDPTQQKRADEIVIDQNQEFYTLLLFVVKKWSEEISLAFIESEHLKVSHHFYAILIAVSPFHCFRSVIGKAFRVYFEFVVHITFTISELLMSVKQRSTSQRKSSARSALFPL